MMEKLNKIKIRRAELSELLKLKFESLKYLIY